MIDEKKLIAEFEYYISHSMGDYHYAYKVGRKLVEIQPVIEAIPAVYGKWIPYFEDVEIYNAGGFRKKEQTGWTCNICGKFTPMHTNFCANCGADMRKKEV